MLPESITYPWANPGHVTLFMVLTAVLPDHSAIYGRAPLALSRLLVGGNRAEDVPRCILSLSPSDLQGVDD